MNEYQGKKYFTIHSNDAGSEAYDDRYVEWLEHRVEELSAELQRATERADALVDEMREIDQMMRETEFIAKEEGFNAGRAGGWY